jgi:exonuclease III
MTNDDSPSLRIWQQNLNKSLVAQHCLLQTTHSRALSHDIVAIQEPYMGPGAKSRALSRWIACYPTPYANATEEQAKKTRSIIFMRKDLDSKSWSQVDVDSFDVTAIIAHTPHRDYLIINAYNDCNHSHTLSTIRRLLLQRRRLLPPDAQEEIILMGDFNRHHPIWDEARNGHLFTNQNLEAATTLLNLLADYSLQMALPPFLPTLRSFSSGNLTRVDNVFVSEGATDVLTSCTTYPEDQPAGTDHFPIETILNIPTHHLPPPTKRNFRKTNWEEFRGSLQHRIADIDITSPILNANSFDLLLDQLYAAIEHCIDNHVPLIRLSPYAKRWWTKELNDLRKRKVRLGRLSYRFRETPEMAVHEEYRLARNHYTEEIRRVKQQHWETYLEELAQGADMWSVHRIISSPSSDGSHTHIPPLETSGADDSINIAKTNDAKAEVLLNTFFPPPTARAASFVPPPPDAYPKPSFSFHPPSDEQIVRAIAYERSKKDLNG